MEKIDLFANKMSNSLFNQLMISLTNLPPNWYIREVDYRVNDLIKIRIFREDMFHINIEARKNDEGRTVFYTDDDVSGKHEYEHWMLMMVAISEFTKEKE